MTRDPAIAVAEAPSDTDRAKEHATSAARIRWRDEPAGSITGQVGTLLPWVFQIFRPERDEEEWSLMAQFPGSIGRVSRDRDREKLKTKAEEWLAEFVSSLGASFPEPSEPSSLGGPDGDRITSLEIRALTEAMSMPDGTRSVTILKVMNKAGEEGWSNHQILRLGGELAIRWGVHDPEKNLYRYWTHLLEMLRNVRRHYPNPRADQ
jgi:hypothetical protein